MMYVLLIVSMTAVTFLPRYLPFYFATRIKLPLGVKQALTYVPIAVLTIMVVQTSLIRDGELSIRVTNPYLWASLAAAACALVQKRLLLTVAAGLLVYALVRILFH